MTCTQLETALKAALETARDKTGVVFHLLAPAGVTEYLVWAEYNLTEVRGDDRCQVQIPRVQIDAYTQDDTPVESNTFFQAVLGVLDALELCYGVQECGYDPDAASVRLIIQCDVA